MVKIKKVTYGFSTAPYMDIKIEPKEKPKPIENWEEKFDERFTAGSGYPKFAGDITTKQVKQFIAKTLKQEIARVGEEIIGSDMDEIPGNIAIYKHQDYAYKAGFNHRALYQRKHLQEILAKL